jgi:putative FmdB family regulatory protein
VINELGGHVGSPEGFLESRACEGMRTKRAKEIMPTYDYICDACGHEFEIFEPITSTPRTDCPECKEIKLRRKIGAGAAIIFKGSGFYQTDYRSESYKKAAQADKTASEPAKAAGDTNSSSSKPAESTSAAKSEAAKPSPAPKGD